MDAIEIKLANVTDTAGRVIPTSVRNWAHGRKGQYVIRFGETARDEYGLGTLIEVALRDTDGLIVVDMFEASAGYTIPISEIRALVRQCMSAHLVEAGHFEVDVKFVRNDPSCPF